MFTETAEAHHRAVSRVIATMHDRLDENLSLRDLAEVAYISPYHFNRVFRRLAGIPPGQFLGALRLQQAKRLLLTTDMSVTDICYEVGYNSQGTFTRRFTQLVGMPPRRLRSLGEGRAAPDGNGNGKRNGHGQEAACMPVEGQLESPEGHVGPAFIGLFPHSIPQSRPVACTVAASSGRFCVPRVPAGVYSLFAASLPPSSNPHEQILCEQALRGGGQRIEVRDGNVSGQADVVLRAPRVTDPPILLTFPLLMRERMARRSHAEGS